jgi:hypothetical protein
MINKEYICKDRQEDIVAIDKEDMCRDRQGGYMWG